MPAQLRPLARRARQLGGRQAALAAYRLRIRWQLWASVRGAVARRWQLEGVSWLGRGPWIGGGGGRHASGLLGGRIEHLLARRLAPPAGASARGLLSSRPRKVHTKRKCVDPIRRWELMRFASIDALFVRKQASPGHKNARSAATS